MKNIPVYNPALIEGKWQRHWEEAALLRRREIP